jgi:hypothetical protein
MSAQSIPWSDLSHAPWDVQFLPRREHQNKVLSDNVDAILSMQGVPWISRTAISYAAITLYVNHYKDENGVEHIDSDQTLTGGFPGTTENRILDWTPRDHYDYVFGAVVGKSRRLKVDEIEDSFLKDGWVADTREHGLVCSWIESDREKSGYNWTSYEVRSSSRPPYLGPDSEPFPSQVWGFEEIQGEIRYARHIKFTEKPGGTVVYARLVYDYCESKLWIRENLTDDVPRLAVRCTSKQLKG